MMEVGKSGRDLAQFSKMSARNSSWTEVQWPPLRRRLFGAAAVTFRGALVDGLPEIHAPFRSGLFFQRRRALDLAGFAPALHQRRTGWAFVRVRSGYSRWCRFLRGWGRRYRRWLRGRRELEWLFPIEISALSACSENKSKRQSEQPFHFVPRRPEPARILPQHALDEGGKRNGLERRVAELLISDRDGTNRPLLGHKRNCASAARAGSRLRTTGRLTTRRCRISKIGNLQQLAVTDPGFRKISLGFARRVGVAACLIQFSQSVV